MTQQSILNKIKQCSNETTSYVVFSREYYDPKTDTFEEGEWDFRILDGLTDTPDGERLKADCIEDGLALVDSNKTGKIIVMVLNQASPKGWYIIGEIDPEKENIREKCKEFWNEHLDSEIKMLQIKKFSAEDM